MTALAERRTCDLLLVDDDVEIRTGIARNLECLGYHVAQAGTLTAAVETLKSREIPVAIVDLVLPTVPERTCWTGCAPVSGTSAASSCCPVRGRSARRWNR